MPTTSMYYKASLGMAFRALAEVTIATVESIAANGGEEGERLCHSSWGEQYQQQ